MFFCTFSLLVLSLFLVVVDGVHKLNILADPNAVLTKDEQLVQDEVNRARRESMMASYNIKNSGVWCVDVFCFLLLALCCLD